MATPVQENLISKNKEYSSSFSEGHLALPPAKKYAVGKPLPSICILYLSFSLSLTSLQLEVTCMDARIDPAAAYGISLGDAHVIRNAGGNAVDGKSRPRTLLPSTYFIVKRFARL